MDLEIREVQLFKFPLKFLVPKGAEHFAPVIYLYVIDHAISIEHSFVDGCLIIFSTFTITFVDDGNKMFKMTDSNLFNARCIFIMLRAFE
jgi:hypothetical protein